MVQHTAYSIHGAGLSFLRKMFATYIIVTELNLYKV